jgi:N-methylhydantoinase A
LIRVSVDVGGTFTDLVALNEENGELVNVKVPSVPRNPEQGFINALKIFLKQNNPDSIRMICHATTIATNAIFGQVDLELPRTALITTKGFRDVIQIGRQKRAEVYNLFFQKPPTLVERRHRYEVEERIDSDGQVKTVLESSELEKILEQISKEDIRSIAVGFVNSYINPEHEMQTVQSIRNQMPDVPISPSVKISSGYREFERFSTAVVNAALIPVISTYLSQLADDLNATGVHAPFYIMQSNGGMAKAESIQRKPVTLVESGPASGVIAASWLGLKTGIRDVISFDMGGTTAKAGIIHNGIPDVVPEYEVAGRVHMGRLLKGSGYPVRFPFIDLAECSAGGGTIVWTDSGGAINVGPTSAGAYPGPACYGRGGTQPTITDANLALGRLNPESLIDGDMDIFPDLAEEALTALGGRLDMAPEEVAVSVIRIANSMMSKILRIISIERGNDPRNYSMVAFGGAGPMHACALAEELGIETILIPINPGMFSALGLLTADIFHDFSRAVVKKTGNVNPRDIHEVYSAMEEQGRRILLDEGVEPNRISFERYIDLRYVGQSYELTVNLEERYSEDYIIDRFHRKHSQIYGYSSSDDPVELVNVRLRAIGEIPEPFLQHGTVKQTRSIGLRGVYFENNGGWIDTPIYDRREIGLGSTIVGPAILEQYDSTTIVYPDWKFEIKDYNIIQLRRLT